MAQLSITMDQADALIDVARHIRIEGAQPGDALKITIDSFAPQPQNGRGWGWTAAGSTSTSGFAR